MRADVFWPKSMRFSPDGRQLVGIILSQLVIIDVATGAIRYPVSSTYGFESVDWSPEGDRLIYIQFNWETSQYDPDSVGVRMLDLKTGVASPPHLYRGSPMRGTFVRWAPDGQRFALDEVGVRGERIMVYGLGDSTRLPLTPEEPLAVFDNLQWLSKTAEDPECLAVMQIGGPGGGPYFIYLDGRRQRLERPIWPRDVFSRDGSYVLTTDRDPVDSAAVLYMRATPRASHVHDEPRQLTSWEGPARR